MSRARTERWSLELTGAWVARQDPECLSVEKADGHGALQISGAVKRTGPVTDADLMSSDGGMTRAAERHPFAHGDFSGFSFSYVRHEILVAPMAPPEWESGAVRDVQL